MTRHSHAQWRELFQEQGASGRLHSTLGYRNPMKYENTLTNVSGLSWPLQIASLMRSMRSSSNFTCV
jgi:hypothetical protein